MKTLLYAIIPILTLFIHQTYALEWTFKDKDYSSICKNIWGTYLQLETYPVQEVCQIHGSNMSFWSFRDKYDSYIKWLMIHYANEYKYSSKESWKSYLDFYAQDIQDLETFSQANISSDIKKKIEKDLSFYKTNYNFRVAESTLWKKITTEIQNSLNKKVKNLSDSEQQVMYKKLNTLLSKKISELEELQKVAKFSSQWYKNFIFKLNVYRYLNGIVYWKIY